MAAALRHCHKRTAFAGRLSPGSDMIGNRNEKTSGIGLRTDLNPNGHSGPFVTRVGSRHLLRSNPNS